jgi:hypothetical protein
MKKGGDEIVQAMPSTAKLDEMVGNATKYEFPDNQDDSDKVSQRVEDFYHPLHFLIKNFFNSREQNFSLVEDTVTQKIFYQFRYLFCIVQSVLVEN